MFINNVRKSGVILTVIYCSVLLLSGCKAGIVTLGGGNDRDAELSLAISATKVSGQCPANSTDTIDLSPLITLSSNNASNNFSVNLTKYVSWMALSVDKGTTPVSVTLKGLCSDLANGEVKNAIVEIEAVSPGMGTATIQVELTKAMPSGPATLVANSVTVEGICGADKMNKIILSPNINLTSSDPNIDFSFSVTNNNSWLVVAPDSLGHTPQISVIFQGDCSALVNGETKQGTVEFIAMFPGTGSTTIYVTFRKLVPGSGDATLILSSTVATGHCDVDQVFPIALYLDPQNITASSSNPNVQIDVDNVYTSNPTWLFGLQWGWATPFTVNPTIECSEIPNGFSGSGTITIPVLPPAMGNGVIRADVTKDPVPEGSPVLQVSTHEVTAQCPQGSTSIMNLSPGIQITSSDPAKSIPFTVTLLSGYRPWIGFGIESGTTPATLIVTGDCSKYVDGTSWAVFRIAATHPDGYGVDEMNAYLNPAP
jgi:hypothetical protein